MRPQIRYANGRNHHPSGIAHAAQAYRDAPEKDRRKLELLLNLRLQEALQSSGSLQDLMRDIGHQAQKRGLTPEILASILDEP